MKHLKALGIKFIFTAIVVYSIFGIFYDASLWRLLWMSILATGILYIIGDLFILPKFGNLIASIADFGLAFLSFWILGNLLIDLSISVTTAALFASVFMAVTEALFHMYMTEQVFESAPKGEATPYSAEGLRTEFADETNKETFAKDLEDREKDK
ncbi:YndM family protein [Virgibacillus flavescens]|uniref:YndM family protein n=1 Tax=Virgibacillus flavescens TaxID=1611422 RepID=UPI003D33B300